MLQTVRTEIIAGGSTTYQLINPCLYDCGTLAAEGSLYNLYSISTLNGLEAEWWDHTFNGDVSFGDKLYFTNGDMGFQSKSSTGDCRFQSGFADRVRSGGPVCACARGNLDNRQGH